MAKNNIKTMSMVLAFGAMSEMLNLSRKIDELKKLPAYVKDGEVFDFNDRSFGDTDAPDGEIYDVSKVLNAQAVTQAMKTGYSKALLAWVNGEEAETKPKAKAKPPVTASEEVEDAEDVEYVDTFFDDVKELLKDGKLKKANKLIEANQDHKKHGKAVKKYNKANADA